MSAFLTPCVARHAKILWSEPKALFAMALACCTNISLCLSHFCNLRPACHGESYATSEQQRQQSDKKSSGMSNSQIASMIKSDSSGVAEQVRAVILFEYYRATDLSCASDTN